jgi:hypothetical protein
MDRNYLKGRLGDRINAVLAAAGYNFGLLQRWLAELCASLSTPWSRLSRLKTLLEPGSSQTSIDFAPIAPTRSCQYGCPTASVL